LDALKKSRRIPTYLEGRKEEAEDGWILLGMMYIVEEILGIKHSKESSRCSGRIAKSRVYGGSIIE
jgi:hypothetical protein